MGEIKASQEQERGMEARSVDNALVCLRESD